MKKIDFLPLSEPFVADAAGLEKECLETAWSENQLRALPPFAVYLIAVSEAGTVCGTGCIYCTGGDAELMNLAVRPGFRRNGIGEALLQKLIACAAGRGCERMLLEVASRNGAALSLYEKTGFERTGLRPGFYRNDDAVLMEKKPLC